MFYAYFLNTAFILLLADANFSLYRFLKYIPVIGKGPYPDLNNYWYIDIAPTLVKTMIIKALFDWILIVIQFTGKIFSRAND